MKKYRLTCTEAGEVFVFDCLAHDSSHAVEHLYDNYPFGVICTGIEVLEEDSLLTS